MFTAFEQDGTEQRRRDGLRARLLLSLAAAVIALAFASIFAAMSYREHEITLAEAARDTGSMARTLEQHTGRLLGGIDLILSAVGEHVGTNALDESKDLPAYLNRRLAFQPQLRALLVVDADGRLLASAWAGAPEPLDWSNNHAILVHLGAATPHLYVGAPLRPSAAAPWIIPMSRPLIDGGGMLRGIVIALLEASQLERFYGSLNVGTHGAIELYRRDGLLLITHPFADDAVGRDDSNRLLFQEISRSSSGFLGASSETEDRLVAFRSVPDLPLVIAVGFDEKEVFAAWERNTWTYGIAAGAIAVITGTLALLLMQQWSRRAAQEAARAAAERDYHGLFENVPDGLYRCDAKGRILRANAALQRLHGFADGGEWEAAQIHIGDWYVEPRRYEELQAALFRDGTVSNFVSEVVQAKTDKQFWISENVRAVYDSAGRLLHYDGSVRDITRLRSAEAETEEANRQLAMRNRQFDVALDHITQGLALHDTEDRLLVCNRRFIELFDLPSDIARPGVLRHEIIAYMLARDTTSHGTRAAIHQKHLRMAASPQRRLFFQRMADGRIIEVVHQPVPGFGTVQTFTDVTARMRTEAALRDSRAGLRERVRELEEISARLHRQGVELRALASDLARARDEAEAASRTKSKFLANMSHELRTPLNAIIGFSEVMKEEIFGPLGSRRYRDYAQDVHDSGTHLLSLINEILDLAKVESGRLELRETEVNIAAVIKACHRLMKERADDAEVELVAKPAPSLPLLLADEIRLKQILLNLVANAIKFTPATGKVTIAAAFVGDGSVQLQVSDTGIGMAPEDVPRAMEPFGQVDQLDERRNQGTGLGLPLTKALTELHGGIVHLESAVGRGTTVTITFPAWRSRYPRLAVNGD